MTYNSGKGTDGAGPTCIGINSISLPWTADVRPRTSAIDAAYSNDNPYYRVHGYQPGHQHDVAPHYPTTETISSHKYDDWTGGLLGASSTLALPGADGAEQLHVLEDDLSWSQFQAYAGESQDLPAMLHQDLWHMLNFLGDADLEAGLTEDITNFMVPGPSSSARGAHVGADVTSTEAGPSSEVPSTSGHESLLTALDMPAEGSPKKRKTQALDLESDAEDGPRESTHGLKKCRVRNPSMPTAELEQGDVAEGSSIVNTEQTAKKKKHLKVRAQSSLNLRVKKSSGIATLRERVFPGSVKSGSYICKSQVAAAGPGSKDDSNETTELQVILKANNEIDENHDMIRTLKNRVEELEDSVKTLKESHVKVTRENRHLKMLNSQLQATGWSVE